jgi:PIN domain nuclease of toxin-antitoxin system
MASKFVLDAHALIWYLEGNPRLSTAAKTIVDDPASDLILPVIALAEAAHVISKGRTAIVSADVLIDRIERDQRLEVYPLTKEVLKTSLRVAVSEMHDRLIVATVIYLGTLGQEVSLVTCDANITSSRLVATIW